MPRDSSGNYTLPIGNPVVDGTIISTDWANPTMSDIAVQLNNVLTRDGLLGPTLPFRLIDGTVGAPSLSFITDADTGLYHPSSNQMAVSVGGTEVGRWTSTGYSGLLPDLSNSSDPTKGDAMVAVKQPFPGAVARTQHDKNWDVIHSNDALNIDPTGAVSSSVGFQALFDGAPAGSTIIIDPGAYKLDAQVTCAKELHVIADGATFNVVVNITPFAFYIAPEIVTLSADYVIGSLAVSVAAMSAALADGRPFKIVSDAVDPANRDSGSSASQYRTGEWSHAGPGTTTTNIVLRSPLRFSKGISPVSVPGEEPVIDAYTVAMNARILLIGRTSMSWEGGFIAFEEGHAGDPWTARAFSVSGYARPYIKNLRISRGYGQGIYLAGNYRPVIEKCSMANLENNTGVGQFGYGIADASYMTLVDGCLFSNCRHGYTTAEITSTAGTTSTSALLASGRIVGATVSNCHGYGSLDAPFDTHHGAEDVTFLNCKAHGGSSYGFTVRGRNIRLIDCEAVFTKYGILGFTEFASGEPDDDLCVAGKPWGCTSLSIINFKAKVESLPFYMKSVRNCRIIGGDIQSTNQQLIRNDGSQISIDGDLVHTVTNFDGAWPLTEAPGRGILHVSPIEVGLAPTADWSATFIVNRGAEIRVEASATVDPSISLAAIRASNLTCTLNNRGRIRLSLNTAFLTLLSGGGGGGSFSGDVDSELRWGVNGAADNTIATGLLGTKMKAVAQDGTAWYDATGFSNGTERLVYRDRPMITVVGTGAVVPLAYVPAYAPVKFINEAGHYVRYEICVSKRNPIGAATLTTRIGTAFNAAIPMAASDKKCFMIIEIFTTGVNAQEIYIESQCSPDTGIVNPATLFAQTTAETTNLSSSLNLLTFDVQSVVGDDITFRSTLVYSDIAGFGV